MMEIAVDQLAKIQENFVANYPNEACGLIVEGKFIPCVNTHEAPLDHFRIDRSVVINFAGQIEAVVHSHTHEIRMPLLTDPRAPSQADMQIQSEMNVPWAIVWCNGETITDPLWLGKEYGSKFEDLIGRQFAHGVFDCFSLVRDYMRIERRIRIKDFPRQDSWWMKGENLYIDNFKEQGWVEIPFEDLRRHDAVLMSVLSPVPNHAAIILGDGTLLHHLSGRLSRRDNHTSWSKFMTHAIRYQGAGA